VSSIIMVADSARSSRRPSRIPRYHQEHATESTSRPPTKLPSSVRRSGERQQNDSESKKPNTSVPKAPEFSQDQSSSTQQTKKESLLSKRRKFESLMAGLVAKQTKTSKRREEPPKEIHGDNEPTVFSNLTEYSEKPSFSSGRGDPGAHLPPFSPIVDKTKKSKHSDFQESKKEDSLFSTLEATMRDLMGVERIPDSPEPKRRKAHDTKDSLQSIRQKARRNLDFLDSSTRARVEEESKAKQNPEEEKKSSAISTSKAQYIMGSCSSFIKQAKERHLQEKPGKRKGRELPRKVGSDAADLASGNLPQNPVLSGKRLEQKDSSESSHTHRKDNTKRSQTVALGKQSTTSQSRPKLPKPPSKDLSEAIPGRAGKEAAIFSSKARQQAYTSMLNDLRERKRADEKKIHKIRMAHRGSDGEQLKRNISWDEPMGADRNTKTQEHGHDIQRSNTMPIFDSRGSEKMQQKVEEIRPSASMQKESSCDNQHEYSFSRRRKGREERRSTSRGRRVKKSSTDECSRYLLRDNNRLAWEQRKPVEDSKKSRHGNLRPSSRNRSQRSGNEVFRPRDYSSGHRERKTSDWRGTSQSQISTQDQGCTEPKIICLVDSEIEAEAYRSGKITPFFDDIRKDVDGRLLRLRARLETGGPAKAGRDNQSHHRKISTFFEDMKQGKNFKESLRHLRQRAKKKKREKPLDNYPPDEEIIFVEDERHKSFSRSGQHAVKRPTVRSPIALEEILSSEESNSADDASYMSIASGRMMTSPFSADFVGAEIPIQCDESALTDSFAGMSLENQEKAKDVKTKPRIICVETVESEESNSLLASVQKGEENSPNSKQEKTLISPSTMRRHSISAQMAPEAPQPSTPTYPAERKEVLQRGKHQLPPTPPNNKSRKKESKMVEEMRGLGPIASASTMTHSVSGMKQGGAERAHPKSKSSNFKVESRNGLPRQISSLLETVGSKLVPESLRAISQHELKNPLPKFTLKKGYDFTNEVKAFTASMGIPLGLAGARSDDDVESKLLNMERKLADKARECREEETMESRWVDVKETREQAPGMKETRENVAGTTKIHDFMDLRKQLSDLSETMTTEEGHVAQVPIMPDPKPDLETMTDFVSSSAVISSFLNGKPEKSMPKPLRPSKQTRADADVRRKWSKKPSLLEDLTSSSTWNSNNNSYTAPIKVSGLAGPSEKEERPYSDLVSSDVPKWEPYRRINGAFGDQEFVLSPIVDSGPFSSEFKQNKALFERVVSPLTLPAEQSLTFYNSQSHGYDPTELVSENVCSDRPALPQQMQQAYSKLSFGACDPRPTHNPYMFTHNKIRELKPNGMFQKRAPKRHKSKKLEHTKEVSLLARSSGILSPEENAQHIPENPFHQKALTRRISRTENFFPFCQTQTHHLPTWSHSEYSSISANHPGVPGGVSSLSDSSETVSSVPSLMTSVYFPRDMVLQQLSSVSESVDTSQDSSRSSSNLTHGPFPKQEAKEAAHTAIKAGRPARDPCQQIETDPRRDPPTNDNNNDQEASAESESRKEPSLIPHANEEKRAGGNPLKKLLFRPRVGNRKIAEKPEESMSLTDDTSDPKKSARVGNRKNAEKPEESMSLTDDTSDPKKSAKSESSHDSSKTRSPQIRKCTKRKSKEA
jgi:hypothetical protein